MAVTRSTKTTRKRKYQFWRRICSPPRSNIL